MVRRRRPADLVAACGALLTFAFALAAPPASAASIESRKVVSRGKKRTYALYVPASVAADKPAPLLVAVHGSTSNGKTIVERWTDIADAHGMIVAGPDATDNKMWVSPQDGPLFLKERRRRREVAPDRRAPHDLFGHSAGANFALQMAMLESEFFAAAVAVGVSDGATDADHVVERGVDVRGRPARGHRYLGGAPCGRLVVPEEGPVLARHCVAVREPDNVVGRGRGSGWCSRRWRRCRPRRRCTSQSTHARRCSRARCCRRASSRCR